MLDLCFQSILVNETTATFSPAAFLACMAASLVLGIVIAVIFMYRNTYTKGFVVTLAHLSNFFFKIRQSLPDAE